MRAGALLPEQTIPLRSQPSHRLLTCGKISGTDAAGTRVGLRAAPQLSPRLPVCSVHHVRSSPRPPVLAVPSARSALHTGRPSPGFCETPSRTSLRCSLKNHVRESSFPSSYTLSPHQPPSQLILLPGFIFLLFPFSVVPLLLEYECQKYSHFTNRVPPAPSCLEQRLGRGADAPARSAD